MTDLATARRRAKFRRALAAAGMTQSDFARQAGVTKGHLSLVLNGHRPSPPLTAKIVAFSRSQVAA